VLGEYILSLSMIFLILLLPLFTQIHDHSLFWVGTDALFFFRIAGVKLVLWIQTSTLGGIMLSFKCCPHMSEMSTFTYNLANSIIRKNAIIMSIIHNMFPPLIICYQLVCCCHFFYPFIILTIVSLLYLTMTLYTI
jgi:hypothetical protein